MGIQKIATNQICTGVLKNNFYKIYNGKKNHFWRRRKRKDTKGR
jgi:hypothetical protein